jgi:hypothetical protein
VRTHEPLAPIEHERFGAGFYELTRQRVEEMRQQQTAPEPPKPVYARGSVEWSRQQAEAEETNPSDRIHSGLKRKAQADELRAK